MKYLAAAIITLLLAACGKPPAAPEAPKAAARAQARDDVKLVELDAASLKETSLAVAPVLERSIPLTVRASGRLTTNENTTWRVGAVTDGRIILADSKVGDRVTKGQILARMHSHDIHESRALYRKAVTDLNRLKSGVEFATRQRDRLSRLYALKAASQEQLDSSENELRIAKAAVTNAEIEVGRTRQHLVEFLEVSVDGTEEHEHDSSPEMHIEDLIPIRAPAAGIILTRAITPGAVVTASNDLYTICDLSTIWAIAAVQEEQLARLRPGMAASISVQAYPTHTFHGRVVKIEDKLNPETRTIAVRIEIDNRQGLLKPEMYATVELAAGGSASALFVPQEAVQDVNGQATVFIEKKPGQYEPRAVETGRPLEGLLQIQRGLQGGERVVAAGSFILKSQLLKSSLSEE